MYREIEIDKENQIVIKKLYIPLFFIFIVASCQNASTKKVSDRQKSLCDQINEDSLVTLNGTLIINSKDTIVFENFDQRNGLHRKIHLIPCSKNLKEYIFKSYDAYIYLKNFDEKFWVRVDGKFLANEAPESRPQFLFNFVALIDELEAKTDSSQATRENTKDWFEQFSTILQKPFPTSATSPLAAEHPQWRISYPQQRTELPLAPALPLLLNRFPLFPYK
jgi:hypothetical protein